MKKNSIILTEAEITSLIKASSRENKLDLCFGGELLPVPSNDWAFKMVEEMRKPKADFAVNPDDVLHSGSTSCMTGNHPVLTK